MISVVRGRTGSLMPMWLIPMVYTAVSVVAGVVLPRIEHTYFAGHVHEMSVGSATAFFSSVSSGMMALTGIVFAIAFVVVQFSALAYSPRLVVMFANDPTLFHTLGIFFATFTYSLVVLMWTDRGGSGTVPQFSTTLVTTLLIVSMIAFAKLIQNLNKLQIHNVLQFTGARGRAVIRTMFVPIANSANGEQRAAVDAASDLGPVTQTITYSGEPRVIARLDIGAMVRLAQSANAVMVLECGVGETLVDDTTLIHVHGATHPLPERALMRMVRLTTSRTFEQDPKYAIRLLVDIAIKALSPAINDPTTAVQALDQIEDLLRRLGRRELDAGRASDANGALRLIFPMPTWEDYLALSFDEIRQYGATSVQVVRRLRSALVGLGDTVAVGDRRNAVLQYLEHLNRAVGRSTFDDQDQAAALLEDRQGLGLSRKRRVPKPPSAVAPDLRQVTADL
jgi:uncharacterized membrane protein